MKATPAQDEATDRFIALTIAAVYHGLIGAGNGAGAYANGPGSVIETAEIFRKYIETGKIDD